MEAAQEELRNKRGGSGALSARSKKDRATAAAAAAAASLPGEAVALPSARMSSACAAGAEGSGAGYGAVTAPCKSSSTIAAAGAAAAGVAAAAPLVCSHLLGLQSGSPLASSAGSGAGAGLIESASSSSSSRHSSAPGTARRVSCSRLQGPSPPGTAAAAAGGSGGIASARATSSSGGGDAVLVVAGVPVGLSDQLQESARCSSRGASGGGGSSSRSSGPSCNLVRTSAAVQIHLSTDGMMTNSGTSGHGGGGGSSSGGGGGGSSSSSSGSSGGGGGGGSSSGSGGSGDGASLRPPTVPLLNLGALKRVSSPSGLTAAHHPASSSGGGGGCCSHHTNHSSSSGGGRPLPAVPEGAELLSGTSSSRSTGNGQHCYSSRSSSGMGYTTRCSKQYSLGGVPLEAGSVLAAAQLSYREQFNPLALQDASSGHTLVEYLVMSQRTQQKHQEKQWQQQDVGAVAAASVSSSSGGQQRGSMGGSGGFRGAESSRAGSSVHISSRGSCRAASPPAAAAATASAGGVRGAAASESDASSPAAAGVASESGCGGSTASAVLQGASPLAMSCFISQHATATVSAAAAPTASIKLVESISLSNMGAVNSQDCSDQAGGQQQQQQREEQQPLVPTDLVEVGVASSSKPCSSSSTRVVVPPLLLQAPGGFCLPTTRYLNSPKTARATPPSLLLTTRGADAALPGGGASSDPGIVAAHHSHGPIHIAAAAGAAGGAAGGKGAGQKGKGAPMNQRQQQGRLGTSASYDGGFHVHHDGRCKGGAGDLSWRNHLSPRTRLAVASSCPRSRWTLPSADTGGSPGMSFADVRCSSPNSGGGSSSSGWGSSNRSSVHTASCNTGMQPDARHEAAALGAVGCSGKQAMGDCGKSSNSSRHERHVVLTNLGLMWVGPGGNKSTPVPQAARVHGRQPCSHAADMVPQMRGSSFGGDEYQCLNPRKGQSGDGSGERTAGSRSHGYGEVAATGVAAGGGLHSSPAAAAAAGALARQPRGQGGGPTGSALLNGVLKGKPFTPPAGGRVRFISVAKQGLAGE